jgi:hypothetical protein
MGSITMNPQIYERIKQQAEKEGRSVANFLANLFTEKFGKENEK